MKANELMIGDWVLFDHNPVRVAILGAAQDSLGLAVGDNVFGQPYSIIEPIPLTAEILEKNGFDMDDYTVHFKEDEHYMLELVFEDDELKWTINCNEYTIMNFEYVHELQHALRLCGIEKEIEL